MAYDKYDDEALEFEDTQRSACPSGLRGSGRRRKRRDKTGAKRPGTGRPALRPQADAFRRDTNAAMAAVALETNRKMLMQMRRKRAAAHAATADGRDVSTPGTPRAQGSTTRTSPLRPPARPRSRSRQRRNRAKRKQTGGTNQYGHGLPGYGFSPTWHPDLGTLTVKQRQQKLLKEQKI